MNSWTWPWTTMTRYSPRSSSPNCKSCRSYRSGHSQLMSMALSFPFLSLPSPNLASLPSSQVLSPYSWLAIVPS